MSAVAKERIPREWCYLCQAFHLYGHAALAVPIEDMSWREHHPEAAAEAAGILERKRVEAHRG